MTGGVAAGARARTERLAQIRPSIGGFMVQRSAWAAMWIPSDA